MARCHHCGSTFFFGAVREGEHRYCSDDRRGQNAFKVRCDQIPESTVLLQVRAAQQGNCPECHGRAPRPGETRTDASRERASSRRASSRRQPLTTQTRMFPSVRNLLALVAVAAIAAEESLEDLIAVFRAGHR